MKIIKIGSKTIEIPIIQGGMGIGVSLGNLAGAVAEQGGMGVISAANPGFRREDFHENPLEANMEALSQEIEKARTIAKDKGMIAVNIMVAMKDYRDYVKSAVKNKVDAIISGAGLPLDLPQLTKGSDTMLAPIVSSGKAATLICKMWDKKYEAIPDFVVIEGSEAGGHLGFSEKELRENTTLDLKSILDDVKEALAPFQEKFQKHIPIFVAGGIFTGKDIANFLNAGADGVQMGTRFIGTYECDAPDSYKEVFINAGKEDMTLIASPVGMPGRAIQNKFVEYAEDGRKKVKKCIACIKSCNPSDTPYCITEALVNAVSGNNDKGLFFSGTKGYLIDKLVNVKELIEELTTETKEFWKGQ